MTDLEQRVRFCEERIAALVQSVHGMSETIQAMRTKLDQNERVLADMHRAWTTPNIENASFRELMAEIARRYEEREDE